MTMGDTFGPAERRPQLRGVSGWLLFLCITLLVFLPIRVALVVWVLLTSPFSSDNLTGTIVFLVIFMALPLFGIVAGVLLYQEKRLGLVLTRTYLGAQLLLGLFVMIQYPTIVVQIAPAAAWLVYLFRSERVRNTYFADTTRDAAEVFR